MNRRHVLKTGAASLAALSIGRPFVARAAEWPTRSIRVIVPYAAGSATDLMPRTVFEQVGQQVGQTSWSKTAPAAAPRSAPPQVKQADPDGHTMLVHSNAHRHRAGDSGQRALRSGAGFFRSSRRSATCRWCWWSRRARASRPQGAGCGGQGQAGRDQLCRCRHRHAAASGDGAVSPGRRLRGPARAVQGRARGADRGDGWAGRHLFCPIMPAMSLIKDGKVLPLAV